MYTKSEKPTISILFISTKYSDIRELDDRLCGSDNMAYHVEYRESFRDSTDLLEPGQTSIDVILLDLEVVSEHYPREVFNHILKMANGIPLIIFTGRGGYSLPDFSVKNHISSPDDGKISQAVDEIVRALKSAKLNDEIVVAHLNGTIRRRIQHTPTVIHP